MSSSVFMPGDVRPTTLARESHIKPADASAAGHVHGTQPVPQKATPPISKAHKAYQTEKKRDKADESTAEDLLPKNPVVARVGQSVDEVLSLLEMAGLSFVAVVDEQQTFRGVFMKEQFLQYAFEDHKTKAALLKMKVENFLTPARTSVDVGSDLVGLVRQFANAPEVWLPVFDLENTKFFGLLTQKDLLMHLHKNRGLDVWI